MLRAFPKPAGDRVLTWTADSTIPLTGGVKIQRNNSVCVQSGSISSAYSHNIQVLESRGKVTMDLKQLRIGYVPLSHNLDKPGDRRRFVYYAKSRNLPFEIATPDEKYDVAVVSQSADLSIWSGYDKGKIVYDFIDSYLAVPRSSVKGRLRGLAKYLSG